MGGSKGAGMEGEGSRTRCAPAGWWQLWQGPTGKDSGTLHLTLCAALLSDVGCRQGSGVFPGGWEIQTQPWPLRLTPVSRGASGADGRAQCPTVHPPSCSCCKSPGGALCSHGRGLRRTAAGFSLKIPPSPQLSSKALKILLPWLRLPRTESPLCAVLTRQPGP